MQALEFVCPDCKQSLKQSGENAVSCTNNHTYNIVDGVYDFMPKEMHPITAGDAIYHDAVKLEYVDMHQIETYKNLYYRREIQRFIAEGSNADAVIVELGGGAGYDLELFLKTDIPFSQYVFSEISLGQSTFVKSKIDDPRIIFSTIDARELPFDDDSVDIVYIMAALHHVPDLDTSIAEILRTIKPGGYFICGFEPNRFIFELFKFLRFAIRKFLPNKGHSPADDELAEGFTRADFAKIAQENQLKIARMQPIWLLCGIAHHGLELTYRGLRLKRRVKLPTFFEKVLVTLDKVLFKVPLIRNYSWSNTVVFQKK